MLGLFQGKQHSKLQFSDVSLEEAFGTPRAVRVAVWVWEKSCAIWNSSRQKPTPGYRPLEVNDDPFLCKTKLSLPVS